MTHKDTIIPDTFLISPFNESLTLNLKSRVLNVPIEIMSYVFIQNLRKPFKVFLYLKVFSSGKLHEDSNGFHQAKKILDIKDARTFNKYFDALLKENWIGYDSHSGMIFIRGFRFIREQHSFIRRRMAQFHFESDIVDLDAFMFGAIVGDRILRYKSFKELEKRRGNWTATKKRGVARQVRFPSSHPSYYGLSVKSMGSMLGLSQTTAHELKTRAVKAGYIKCNNKFRKMRYMDKSDRTIKYFINKADPELAKKIRFKKKVINEKNMIVVLEQLHDEVIPQIDYKSCRLKKRIGKRFNFNTNGVK